MNWRADAACLGANPEDFAERNSHTAADLADLQFTADTYCRSCPVIDACRDLGNTHLGLFGGVYRHITQRRRKVRTLIPGDTRQPARVAS